MSATDLVGRRAGGQLECECATGACGVGWLELVVSVVLVLALSSQDRTTDGPPTEHHEAERRHQPPHDDRPHTTGDTRRTSQLGERQPQADTDHDGTAQQTDGDFSSAARGRGSCAALHNGRMMDRKRTYIAMVWCELELRLAARAPADAVDLLANLLHVGVDLVARDGVPHALDCRQRKQTSRATTQKRMSHRMRNAQEDPHARAGLFVVGTYRCSASSSACRPWSPPSSCLA